ncbi:D-alanyl-D-alanine carboxypeptidase family protein [Streptomyces lydicus]|uniref:D-alanyl-D-alanine carboxypeptidase family protein n=1 Tax=Streptomyces lydicus TaxID=47763 RepID=UPI000526C96E|nr:D-alanyl-D-alanine carboxypeptidase [Streptomyces lydicus]MDC7338478.1 D-alanyl-D-alanine carboxypeptidase [Streptomyces lydicus]UEG92073.1 D-alanyl-D-alanine carboxypeptidase [Streptomyces lydicus]
MAGESPDKSDKKQSSGEAAQSGRDPRLSVLRGKPDEPATETGAAEAAEDSEAPGKGEAPEGSDAPQEATGATADAEGAEGGDGRLRDAVAAWVAGKGDEGDAEEGGDGADRAGGAGESGSESSGSPASEGRASEGSGSEGSGESGAKASVSEGGSEKAGSEKAGSEESGSEESSGAVKGDSEGAAAKPAAKSDAKADAKAGVKSDAKGGKSGAKVGVKGEAKTDAKAAEAEAPVDVTDEAEAKADAKAKVEPAGKADSEVKGKAESGAKSGAKAERKVVDQPTAVFKTVGAQKGASGAEGDGKADDAAGEPGDGEAGDGGSAVDDATRVFAVAKGKGKAASGEAVDQATTAFKINPPAKGRSAEQSKDTKDTSAEQANGKAAEGAKGALGSKDSDKGKEEAASKDKAKDESKGAKGGGSAAESDAERTSQFVALKSADDSAAGRSLGKTAPRTPARTPGKDTSKETAKETPKGAAKDATKDVPKETSKGADKPAGKAPGASGKAAAAAGALPAAAPAKPGTPPKPADRPGAMPPAADAGAAAGLPESERTKQQPLPPLDLLAKLTNTPPPPETPLRIVVRRFKIWTPLAVLLAIIFVVAQSVRPLPDPTLTVGDATSSFTFEGGKLTIPWPAQGQAAIKVVGSGDLGTFGPQKPVPTASVAKIMTAYVILRDHPLKKDEGGPKIEVDAKAVTEGGSRHESRIEGLKAGQKFSQQNMLKMLMIPSGNNIARLLARWDTKSDNEAAFVKKMNAAAKDLGMKNTTYTDPSGLDPKTVSTAVDQLKLAEAVMKYDAFRPIVAMTNADIPGLSQRINSNIDNLLLAGLSIKGIKTGSSTAAGGTLSWAAYKTVDGKDRLILGTMMDQHFKGLDPDGANSLTLVKDNSQKVIEAVRNALTSAPAVKKGQVVGYVDDGLNGLTPVVATKDLKAVGVPGQKLKLSVGDGGKTVPHTAKAGTEVGVLTVGNGESMQKVPVALKEDLVEPSFGAKLVRIT